MKIQIDTEQKIIKVENKVNLLKLVTFLKEILKDDFDNFSLECNTVINWNTNPVLINTNDLWYKRPYYTNTTNQLRNNTNSNIVSYEVS
jgi:hypothetical protein